VRRNIDVQPVHAGTSHMAKMKTAIYVGPGRIVLDEKADPRRRPTRCIRQDHDHGDLRNECLYF
jgi:hypothetical protein